MTISQRFNGFYHKVILEDLFKKAGGLKFDGWIDTETGGVFTFYKGLDFNEMDDLKQLLKDMNLDYPMDGDEKISTSDVDSKTLTDHVEWVFRLAAENHIELDIVEQQWRELLKG